MTAVVDASAVVAALTDNEQVGDWARTELERGGLAAPHLMPVETANLLRHGVLRGRLPPDSASLAHDDLLRLSVSLFPYEPLARRIWELRDNLTAYDAWYVALAEALDIPLVTLDRRMAGAAGAKCEFRMPPSL